jgi:hypothetical protein
MSSNPLSPPVMEEAAVRIAAGEKSSLLMAQLGVSRNTLSRWRGRDDFRRRVTELRAEMTRESCGRMATNMTDAADALSNLLKVDDNRVKLHAARQMLALATKLRETVEIEERMQALEEKLLKKK